MTEIAKLHKRLEGMKATNFNIFPGTNPNATPEQIAKAVNSALDQIEMGNFEEISLD